MEQWEFYVVPTSRLDCSKWKESKRMGLGSLAELTEAIPYADLNGRVRTALDCAKAVE